MAKSHRYRVKLTTLLHIKNLIYSKRRFKNDYFTNTHQQLY